MLLNNLYDAVNFAKHTVSFEMDGVAGYMRQALRR
jgi:hypothetical protein